MKEPCRDIEPMLSAHRDGELGADDQRRVDAHLAECARCARVVEAYASTDGALATLAPERTEAEWEALARRVDDALARDAARTGPDPAGGAARRERRPGWLRRPHPFVLGSAATLVVAVMIAVLHPVWSPVPGPKTVEIASDAGRGRVSIREREVPPTSAPVDAPGGTTDGLASKPPGTLEVTEATDAATLDERDVSKESAAEPAPPPVEPAPRSPVAEAPAPALTSGAEELRRESRSPVLLSEDARADAFAMEGAGRWTPAGGATTLAQLETAWQQWSLAEPEAPRPSAASGAKRPATVNVMGLQRSSRDEPLPVRMLAWAREAQDAGRTDDATAAFRLLTGDFPGNPVRTEAWADLLRVEGKAVERAGDPTRALELAFSWDALHASDPDRPEVLEGRARAWVRAARLGAPGGCAAARNTVGQWLDEAPARRLAPDAQALLHELEAACP